jgi:pilus assembly protein Flp/PilA
MASVAVPSGTKRATGLISQGDDSVALIEDLKIRFAMLFVRDDEGQGLAEYALILALIAIVAIIALLFLGGQVSKILSTVGNSV